jgi:hypothetical protein
MRFDLDTLDRFSSTYPYSPIKLSHNLTGHTLFDLERLSQLAACWRDEALEYNAGDLPRDQDPSKTPDTGLSVKETIERIAKSKSWVAIKNVERDEAYAALLDTCLEELEPYLRPLTGIMYKKEAFIFISSPGSVTPFHMDPEHNILLQVRGAKNMRVYPGASVTQQQHEAFHLSGGHRNLRHEDAFEADAKTFTLAPGDALYVPVKAPHWVKNGIDVSVSFSITWRSRLSDRDARLHRTNAWLRAHGATPPPPGAAPLRDGAKALANRLAARISV